MSAGGKPGGGGTLSVLRDKRVQVGAAAAALLGLVVFLRKGGSSSVSGDSIAPAGFDSSGSDLANAVQSAQDGWANDLRAFSDQLRDLNDLLGQRPPSGTGSVPQTIKRPAIWSRPTISNGKGPAHGSASYYGQKIPGGGVQGPLVRPPRQRPTTIPRGLG